jgi:cytochrome c
LNLIASLPGLGIADGHREEAERCGGYPCSGFGRKRVMTHKRLRLATFLLASLALGVAAARPAAAAGDPEKGKVVFNKCMACHSMQPGVNKIGPTLHGVVGTKPGQVPGYSFSNALKNSGLTWDEATLDKWLANPRKLVPGTKMIFPGLSKEEDRQNVIAYLKQAGG